MKIPTEKWLAMRRDFENGLGSIRELSAKHGISFFTARNKFSREGWAGKTKVQKKLERKVDQEIGKRAVVVADRAALFLERQISEGTDLLDMLQRLRERVEKSSDLNDVKNLVASWARIIELNREALGLNARRADEQPKTSLTQIVIQTAAPVRSGLQIVSGRDFVDVPA